MLNAFFASVFSSKTSCSLDSQYPELVEGDGEQNVTLTIREEMVGDLLRHLDVHKLMGPDGIHPRTLRELAEELAKLLTIIYQQPVLSGEVFDTISHSILLKKLSARGLDWRMLRWVKNWLDSQAQRVMVNGVKSS